MVCFGRVVIMSECQLVHVNCKHYQTLILSNSSSKTRASYMGQNTDYESSPPALERPGIRVSMTTKSGTSIADWTLTRHCPLHLRAGVAIENTTCSSTSIYKRHAWGSEIKGCRCHSTILCCCRVVKNTPTHLEVVATPGSTTNPLVLSSRLATTTREKPTKRLILSGLLCTTSQHTKLEELSLL